MADNLSVSTSGGTETLGADEISSVKYPRNKLIFGQDGTNSGDVAMADASTVGPFPVNAYMASDFVLVAGLALTPKFASISISATADTTVVAAVTGKKIRVISLVVSKLDAGEIQFESTAGGTALTGTIEVVAATPLVLPLNPLGWFETVSGEGLNLALTTGTLTAAGCLQYVEV